MKRLSYILILTLLLAACGNAKEKEAPDVSDENVKKYDLVYAEVLNNGSESKMSMEVGYKDNKKLKSERFDTENVVEHILKDESAKPYILIKKNDVHIFRQPYIIFDNEGEFDAKVEKKSVVE
ncbi:hypothetical protein [Macrococcoides caseolyticum]|uniref:Uncharacterized protein n=2 Tax=Macrococcoides caseolyticum TaxID=69966 RepID=A0ACC9MPM9_9STAP|nr:hypothetical protein [Macrococcus caseolyticus]MDJ1110252.1 hypothetical protein [Macrococcus caseolyticus]PKE16520.1 hypothetical protein CW718_09225 [Macrococcus caseolyticus]PKE20750.1 hypothetical protein CW688_10875 [Macrococcus caseolyticus]PKE26818.1 hypothetical protein CW686_02555 [Macrococcus caseolyticus]PKE35998.1 hypothetical protein CW695_05070 [Macrococcus caseolyticus]